MNYLRQVSSGILYRLDTTYAGVVVFHSYNTPHKEHVTTTSFHTWNNNFLFSG